MHVTFESIVQYATLGTLLSGLVSLVVWARIYRRQVNTQIFIEISARYAKLRSFPTGLWARPDPGQPLPERNEDFTAFVLQYLTMLVFAHVLHERRYLANDLWTILRAEHQRTGADPLFEPEWNLVKKQFEMYPNFIVYVDYLLPTRRPELSDRQEVILKVIGPH